ncbi:UNVERIFIED_CONTAM: hypothetical protein FKN15_016129 [Acipenser sinensis]
MLAVMRLAATILQVLWMTAAEPRRSVFQTQAVAPCPQPFLAFLDFMEEVCSSWDHLASAPSVLKHASHIASLEGTEKLGLAGFPPFDSTIAALVKALLVGVTKTHLKMAEVQVTRFANADLWSLASLVVARRQLWLSQERVPDVDKAALLDAPISPGHPFGPAVEILQRSLREREASWQVAALLPPRALARGRSSRWQSPQACIITRTVSVPTAPLGNLRQCLQATAAADDQVLLQGKGNAGRGVSTQQRSRRQFHGRRPRQPLQSAPPQPQHPQQGP